MDLGNTLLNLDMQSRWGSKEQKAEASRLATKYAAEADQVNADMKALSAQTRITDPDAVAAWANAHIALLDRFLTDTDDATARNVAATERKEWQEVASGTRPFVRRNVFYVNYDKDLAAELFGPMP